MISMKFDFFGSLILVGACNISRADEISLCSADEVVVASCYLNQQRKILSFCASADNRIINYRFGLNSRVELSVTFSSEAPLNRWLDVATYTVYLGFRKGEYNYVLGVPQETLGAKAFLDVTKNNKNIMSAKCAGNSFGDKSLSSSAIQDVEDELVRGNGFLFPPDDISEKKREGRLK